MSSAGIDSFRSRFTAFSILQSHRKFSQRVLYLTSCQTTSMWLHSPTCSSPGLTRLGFGGMIAVSTATASSSSIPCKDSYFSLHMSSSWTTKPNDQLAPDIRHV